MQLAVIKELYTLLFNMSSESSDHKWSALRQDRNTLYLSSMHFEMIEIIINATFGGGLDHI